MAEARGPAVAEIQGLLDSVTDELDKVSGDDALRDSRIGELTELLDQVDARQSIAHIAQARQTAEAAYDRALTAIEQAQAPPPSQTADDPTPPHATRSKKRRVVEAKTLWSRWFHRDPGRRGGAS